MTDKYKLPMSSNPRRDVTTTEVGNDVSTIAKNESKHQGTIEKQKLEQIKNAGEVIKLARDIIDIVQIRERTKSELAITDAKMKEMETEATTYIKKLQAETDQYKEKGQIATMIIRPSPI